MKKTRFLPILAIAVSIVLFSCSEESDNEPLIADFEVEVSGKAPEAELTFTNNSTGASSYMWTFGVGASNRASLKKEPEAIAVDKAGDFEIKLVASNGSGADTLTKTVSINGNSAIVSYQDIEFGTGTGNYGRFYSFIDEQMYQESEVDGSKEGKIHIAFESTEGTMYYFNSPAADTYDFISAPNTKFTNYESDPTITTDDFDSMQDDELLQDLTIIDDGDSFGKETIPHTVLFELSKGKKGVIKTREVNSERILVDIKIQKYSSLQ